VSKEDNGSADPMVFQRLAQKYLEDRQHATKDTLWWWQGVFWAWSQEEPRYRQYTFREQVYIVLEWLCTKEIGSRHKQAEDVTHCLAALCALPPDTKPPCWLGGATRHAWYLALQNGIVDPLAASRGLATACQRHSPRWFSSVLLPYEYKAKALCPTWEEWLDDRMSGDKTRVALLQEFMGHWLVPDPTRQSALFLVGDEGTGKSTVAHIAKNLLGVGNCSFLGVSDLGKAFAISETDGKLLNISDELGDLPMSAESTFKWFLGGIEMSFEKKHQNRYTALPTARLLVCVNTYPQISDPTGAVYRRIRVLPMDKTVPREKYDYGLRDRLMAELPGIFNWAVAGLTRLLAHGFTRCEAGEQSLLACQSARQTHRGFVEDRLRARNETDFVSNADLIEAYREWCREQGAKPNTDAAVLIRTIQRQFPQAMAGRKRVAGKQQRGLYGVAWTSD
jgi:putative DNA primase/helicase